MRNLSVWGGRHARKMEGGRHEGYLYRPHVTLLLPSLLTAPFQCDIRLIALVNAVSGKGVGHPASPWTKSHVFVAPAWSPLGDTHCITMTLKLTALQNHSKVGKTHNSLKSERLTTLSIRRGLQLTQVRKAHNPVFPVIDPHSVLSLQ